MDESEMNSRFSNNIKCRTGLDFVNQELIGSLCLLLLWSHVSEFTPTSCRETRHQRREEMTLQEW